MKFIMLSLLSLSAFASIGTTATSVTNISQDFFKKIAPNKISYFSAFSGPSLSQESQANANGEFVDGGINTWTQVSFGWKINDNFRFVVNPRFSINHNSKDANTFEFQNPVFGISGAWYKKGSFIFGGGVNTILPAFRKASTQNSGLMFNPGGFQYMNYTINSKLSVGTWLNARAFFYEGSNDVDRTEASLTVSPLVTYTLSDKFSTSFYYEVNGKRLKNNPLTVSDSDNFGLVGIFAINKFLTVQPIINVFRANGFDLSKANFNMWLSGRLF